MKLFQFGIFDKKLIYPLFMSISFFLVSFGRFSLTKANFNYEGSTDKIYFYHHPFFVAWLMFLSETLQIFLYCIHRYRSKRKALVATESQIQQVDPKEEMKNDSSPYVPTYQKKFTIKIFLVIFGLHILDATYCIITSILRETKLTFSDLMVKSLFIIPTSIISSRTLHFKYFKHHYLGIGIIIFGIVIYTINDILYIQFEINDFLLDLGLIVIAQIAVSIQECGEKYLMHFKFLNPFSIIAFEGIAGCFTSCFMFIILYYIKCPSNTPSLCNKRASPTESVESFLVTTKFILHHPSIFVWVFFLVITYIMFNSFRILTNQNFTPSHRSISDAFGSFLFWILNIIFCFANSYDLTFWFKWTYYVVALISYLIILIGILIYLEILIITCCGFHLNTKKNIFERERIEQDILVNDSTIQTLSLLTVDK